MSTVRRRSVSPTSSDEDEKSEGMDVSDNSRRLRRPRKLDDDNDPSYDDGDDDEGDESYSEYEDDEEGQYEEDDDPRGERYYYEDDEHGIRRRYQHHQGGVDDDDDDDVERDRYNRRSQYEREDSMDVDDILLSNELFPITEMSLSSNATAAGAAVGGGSSGGVGGGASLVGGGGSSSGGSAGGGGAIPSGSMVSNMTSASTLNSSVVVPYSPSAYRRTGSSRQSLGTYVGPSDPNDSYYAEEDYHDNHPRADGDHDHRHATAAEVEVEIDDDDEEEEEEGDTTLHGTVTEDGEDEDENDSHAEDDEEDDHPSVSQYTEHTYATAVTTSTAGSPSQRSLDSAGSNVNDDDEEEEEDEEVEVSRSSRNRPQRTSSARSASQRSGQSRSRRSRASSSSAVSTSHNTTTTTTSSASASATSSRSRSTSASSAGSQASGSSASRSRSRRSDDDDYDDGEDDGSHSMEGDYDDENDHRGGQHDESSQRSMSQSHSHHSGSDSRSRRSEGSYDNSQGSYSREGSRGSRSVEGSRQSGDGSYRSEGGGSADPSRRDSEGSSYRSRMDDEDAAEGDPRRDNDESYRSNSRSGRSRSSRSSSRRSRQHDSYGSNVPDGSARSYDDDIDGRDSDDDADRSYSRRTSSSRGSASRHPSGGEEENLNDSARSNLSRRSSSHRSTSYRSSASRASRGSYASGSRSAGDGSSRRSQGEMSSNSRSDRSDSNRKSMSFDGDGSYNDNDDSGGYPPDESEHDGAIINQKRYRDHNQHPPQTDQGYLSGESHGTPKHKNVADSTRSDGSDNGLADGDSVGDSDHEDAPNNHMISDEAIMEALQESGLAGIDGVVVEVGDDGVVRISSSHHEEDDDEFDSNDGDDEGEGQRINGEENVSKKGLSKWTSDDRSTDAHGEDNLRNREPAENMDLSGIAEYDAMLAASAPASPDRSRGGNSSGPGSPVATTAMSGSVMSEAGWTSVTSDTNLSNEDGGNSSSDEDEMGPKLPQDPYDGRSSAHDGGRENGSESNAEEDDSYGEYGEQSRGTLDDCEDTSHSKSQPSDRSQTSAAGSDHDSKSYSRHSGAPSENSASNSHSSGTDPRSFTGRTMDDSRSGRSHSHSAEEGSSRSGTRSYTESPASASRQSATYDSPLKDDNGSDADPAAEILESAQSSAALSESQSFSELDDPTRLNKARARLLAAYASSGYEDASASSPEQRSAKSFDRRPSQSSKLKSLKSDSVCDDENIDALVIAVAAGAAAAAEAAPEEDEVFVDKVDVWSAAVDDKQAEFETSQRESSTSQNDPSYRSQASRQSYFETENKDPLEEPSNSYRDGYDMDIEEPTYRADTFYEENLPRQGYGRSLSYQETLAYAGSYPEVVASEKSYGDSYYLSGDKHSEKLEASPSGLIPTLSLDTGDDEDDEDEDDDVDTGAAQDPELPGKKKIVLAAKSDEIDAPESSFSKRDVRRMVIAGLATALLMLCIFLPVLLTRRAGTTPVPAPTTPKPTFTPTLSPSLRPKPEYVITGGPFDGTAGSGFGASVAMGSDLAVIGNPFLSSASSFVYSNLGWGLGTNLTGQSDSQFGAALAVAGSGLLIGAPEALDVSLASRTGAAYFFEWNRVEENWSILGSALPGYSATLDAGSRFGAAVAASLCVYFDGARACGFVRLRDSQSLTPLCLRRSDRVAIGAPGSDGRVYIFQFTETSSSSYDWLQMNNSPLTGLSNSGRFGTSVDISEDGFRVVGGAPEDAAGSALVYLLSPDTSSWELEFQAIGATVGELFGSSVRFLSPSGDYVAVGGPGGSNGGGLIRVYTSTQGSYEQLGSDITGEDGQALGAIGSLAGNQSGGGLFLLAGTEKGTIRRFDFASSTQSWMEDFVAVTTGENSRVTGLSTSGTDTFIVGQSEVAVVSIFSVDTIPNQPPSVAPASPFAPTLSPIAATALPTVGSSPTSQSPTSLESRFVLVGGPFVGSSGSTLGKSVAMSDSVMAAGDTSGEGTVQTFQYNSETWQELAFIQGSETGSLFGFSIDATLLNASLVVGAPSTLKNGTSTAVGSAFVYTFDAGTSAWKQVGSQLRGEEDIFAANEAFGASVATSDNGQIVVAGAPFSSELNIVRGGRVYAFEFNTGLGDWTPRQAASLTGDQAETNLGTSIDLSSDGSILFAGGPGRNSDTGYVVVYAWDGYRYSILSTLEGESVGERFGTCVRILSVDGEASYVAVGAPGYNNSQGTIRIFQRQGDGTYSLREPSIVGFAGDGLGARGSVASGGVDESTNALAVIAATSSGMLRKYLFDPESESWDDGSSLSTGMTSSPALASSPDGMNVVVGGNNQASIYITL